MGRGKQMLHGPGGGGVEPPEGGGGGGLEKGLRLIKTLR